MREAVDEVVEGGGEDCSASWAKVMMCVWARWGSKSERVWV